MFFRLHPLIATILFAALITFTLFFYNHYFVWWVLAVGSVAIYVFVKKSVGKFTSTILPTFLILGSLPFLSLMSTVTVRSVSIFFLSVALYLSLLAKGRLNDNPRDKLAIPLLNGLNFFIFFIWANLLFASFINFSERVYPVWAMLVMTAILSFIVAKDILENNLYHEIKSKILEKNDINVASLITALLTSEITWSLTYYPFRYRSSAVILLSAFYIFFTATQFFLTKEEKSRKLAKDIIVVLIAILLILITSKWRYY